MREPANVMDAISRVCGLVAGPRIARLALGITGLLAIADLILTVHVARTVGLLEVNPIARALAEHSGAIGLAAFKALTVGLGVGLLLRARRILLARGAALAVLAAHAWMMFQWVAYMDVMGEAHGASLLLDATHSRLAMRL